MRKHSINWPINCKTAETRLVSGQHGQEIPTGLRDLYWNERMSQTLKEERLLESSESGTPSLLLFTSTPTMSQKRRRQRALCHVVCSLRLSSKLAVEREVRREQDAGVEVSKARVSTAAAKYSTACRRRGSRPRTLTPTVQTASTSTCISS